MHIIFVKLRSYHIFLSSFFASLCHIQLCINNIILIRCFRHILDTCTCTFYSTYKCENSSCDHDFILLLEFVLLPPCVTPNRRASIMPVHKVVLCLILILRHATVHINVFSFSCNHDIMLPSKAPSGVSLCQPVSTGVHQLCQFTKMLWTQSKYLRVLVGILMNTIFMQLLHRTLHINEYYNLHVIIISCCSLEPFL